jgi:hypothetical protein
MHDNALSERGTTNALLSYARILKRSGLEVGVSYSEKHKANNRDLISKVSLDFELFPYKDFTKFSTQQSGKWNFAYWIKSGENDGKTLDGAWNIVHSVFQTYEPHGQSYLYVSKWLAAEMKKRYLGSPIASEAIRKGTLNADKFEYLPHIVDMPQSDIDSRRIIRDKLRIGLDDLVGIRYGGYETFDLKIAQNAISLSLAENSKLHYVFINTRSFIRHPRVHFLPTVIDDQAKSDLLNASDFFIHGRVRGESFGLSIAEAMACGLPAYVWDGGEDRNHLELVTKEFWYSSEAELCSRIKRTVPNAAKLTFKALEEFTGVSVQSKLMALLKMEPNVKT